MNMVRTLKGSTPPGSVLQMNVWTVVHRLPPVAAVSQPLRGSGLH